MKTAILQLLVFVIVAFSFAIFVLWKDRREHRAKVEREAQEDLQGSLYFSEHRSEGERDHRGVAMSRLTR